MKTELIIRHRVAAFTLIEVLVVVAIIALLITILLPSLRVARAEAKAVTCQSSLRQVMVGVQTYQLAYAGEVPSNIWSEYDWPGPEDRGWSKAYKKNLWFYKLEKQYLPDPKVFICAADPFASRFDFAARRDDGLHNDTSVPSCGYGMNYILRNMYKIEKFGPKRPANTILLAEVGPDDKLVTAPLGFNSTPGQPWRDGGRIVWDDGARSWYTGPTWLTERHMGTINMSSIDGGVHRVRTTNMLRKRIRKFYEDCAAGDCHFCVYAKDRGDSTHYSFRADRLWWWTGDADIAYEQNN